VARRFDHFAVQRADGELLAVLEQMIELGAVTRHVDGIEDGPENALHIAYVLADRHRGAGLELDVRRARQMIGMRVGFQNLRYLDTALVRLGENSVG
jgi:hypothetical protein